MSTAESSPSALTPLTRPRSKRVLVTSVLASVCLLAGVLIWVDAGAVWQKLEGVDVRWLGPALLVNLVQLGLLGWRWSAISKGLDVPLGVGRATREYALSRVVNHLLPTGVAGDGLRALRHARLVPRAQITRVVEALALDRFSGQLAVWAVVALTSPLAPASGLTLDVAAVATAALALSVVGVALWQLSRRIKRLQGAMARLSALLRRNLVVLLAPRSALVHLSLSLFIVGTLLVQLYVAARAVGVHLSAAQLLWMGPVMLVASSAPSFFGGWGIREGAVAVLFASIGLDSSTGLAVSVVYGLFDLVVCLPGLLSLVVDTKRPTAPNLSHWTHLNAVALAAGAGLACFWRIPSVLVAVATASFGVLFIQWRGRWTPQGHFGSANWVSSLRLALTCGLLLVAVERSGLWLAGLVVGNLLLDGVDGWLARKHGTSSEFGASLDIEIDSLSVMALTAVLFLRDIAGPWVLVAGLLRYLFVLLPLALPARGQAPPRSRLARAAYVTMLVCFATALVVPQGLGNLLASVGTLAISASFFRSFCTVYFPSGDTLRSSAQ